MGAVATSTRAAEWMRGNARRLLVLAAVLLLWRTYSWWISPEHRIEQFIGAVNSRGAGSLLRLADPAEIQRVHLTEAKLAGMLKDATGTPGGVRVAFVGWEDLNEKQGVYDRWGEVQLQDEQGQPALDYRGRPARLMVQAYNTDDGWKIGVTNFLIGVIAGRYGLKGMGIRYWTLCKQYQVAPEAFNPTNGEWFDLTPPPGYSLPPADARPPAER